MIVIPAVIYIDPFSRKIYDLQSVKRKAMSDDISIVMIANHFDGGSYKSRCQNGTIYQ
jgi:hypothetical protein